MAVSPLGQKAPGYFSVFNVRSATKVVMLAKHKSPSHRYVAMQLRGGGGGVVVAGGGGMELSWQNVGPARR